FHNPIKTNIKYKIEVNSKMQIIDLLKYLSKLLLIDYIYLIPCIINNNIIEIIHDIYTNIKYKTLYIYEAPDFNLLGRKRYNVIPAPLGIEIGSRFYVKDSKFKHSYLAEVINMKPLVE